MFLYEVATKPSFLQFCWSECEVSEFSDRTCTGSRRGGVYVLKQVQVGLHLTAVIFIF